MREDEKQALIEWLRENIPLLEKTINQTALNDVKPHLEKELLSQQIALAALLAEPVGWRYRYLMPHMKNVDGTMGWVGNWKLTDDISCCNKSKGYEIEDLFTTPPLPAVPDVWIKCSDTAPEPDEWVIGYTDYDGVIFHIKIGDDGQWMTNYQQWSGSTVTHWMPLPEPPEVP